MTILMPAAACSCAPGLILPAMKPAPSLDRAEGLGSTHLLSQSDSPRPARIRCANVCSRNAQTVPAASLESLDSISEEAKKKWFRKPVGNWDPAQKDLSFQQMDTDYYTQVRRMIIARDMLCYAMLCHDMHLLTFLAHHFWQAPRQDMPAFARKNGAEYKLYGGVLPIMRLFGVTQEGHSVVAHIHGYEPYFYVQVGISMPENSRGSHESACAFGVRYQAHHSSPHR